MFILSAKLPAPNKLALDVGCGTGQSTRPLAKYFDQVLGLDVSESQLDVAKSVEGTPSNVSYTFFWDNKWCVLIPSCTHHLTPFKHSKQAA